MENQAVPNIPTGVPLDSEPTQTNSTQEKRRLLFITTFVLLWLSISWFTLGAWFHSHTPGGWYFFILTFALTIIPLTTLRKGMSGESYPSASTRLFILRPFWYAMLFLPLIAAGTLIAGIIGLPFEESTNLARWSTAITLPALTFIAIVGWYHSRKLALNTFSVTLPRIPKEFDGLKIAQISDLHVGPHTSRSYLAQVKESVMRQTPDLIVITGDQVDDFAEDVEHFNNAFADLQAPHGVYAVIGNHDIYGNWIQVKRGLQQAGIQVPLNQSIPIERNGQRLWIAGTGDPAANPNDPSQAPAAPDIPKTLEKVPPHEPVIALAHNPALWPELAKHKVDLTLSGHTHYGQFAIPFLNWSLASPFLELAMGLHKQDDSTLYIHPGTGFWALPLRFGTPSEIALITLKST